MDSSILVLILVGLSTTLLTKQHANAEEFVYKVLPPVYNAGKPPPTPVYHPPFRGVPSISTLKPTTTHKPVAIKPKITTHKPSITTRKPSTISYSNPSPVASNPSSKATFSFGTSLHKFNAKVSHKQPIPPINYKWPATTATITLPDGVVHHKPQTQQKIVHKLPTSTSSHKFSVSADHKLLAQNVKHELPVSIISHPPASTTPYKLPTFITTQKLPATKTTQYVPPASTTQNLPSPIITHQPPTSSTTLKLPTSITTHNSPTFTTTHKVPPLTNNNQISFTKPNLPSSPTTHNLPESTTTYNLPVSTTTPKALTSAPFKKSVPTTPHKSPDSITKYPFPENKPSHKPSRHRGTFSTPAAIHKTKAPKPIRKHKTSPRPHQPVYKPDEVPHDPNVVYNKRGQTTHHLLQERHPEEPTKRRAATLTQELSMNSPSRNGRTPYSFQYRIDDHGSRFARSEASDGGNVSGSFTLLLSNTHHFTFTYGR